MFRDGPVKERLWKMEFHNLDLNWKSCNRKEKGFKVYIILWDHGKFLFSLCYVTFQLISQWGQSALIDVYITIARFCWMEAYSHELKN